MYAVKLETQITADHQIHLQLPSDSPVAKAEVIVLIEPEAVASAGESLQAFFAKLDQSDRPRLSAEEVDRWIEDERNAWE
jgi:hypothetical protein